MKAFFTLLSLALVFLIFFGTSLFGKRMVLFSPVSGQLINKQSLPEPGIKIIRTWKEAFGEHEGKDETITDQNGEFKFSEVNGKGFWQFILPSTPSVVQDIFAVRRDGTRVTLFGRDKSNYLLGGEIETKGFDQGVMKIVCLLDEEASADNKSGFWGTCELVTWQE